ncbi:MAG: DinB family protein [Flavobacteriales bacterium]|nr:DinB family protein [Flavobacteriales bacterium]
MPRMAELTDADASLPSAPGKWCPKEVIGHLIDSASNNHGRFVRAQGMPGLRFEGYDQDHWVRVQHYRSADWRELLTLWSALNLHLAYVMEGTPATELTRARVEHDLGRIAFHPPDLGEPATLLHFMADYVDHLEHHLRQVLKR